MSSQCRKPCKTLFCPCYSAYVFSSFIYIIQRGFNLNLSLIMGTQDVIFYCTVFHSTAPTYFSDNCECSTLPQALSTILSSQKKQQYRDSVCLWIILVTLDMTSIKQVFCGDQGWSIFILHDTVRLSPYLLQQLQQIKQTFYTELLLYQTPSIHSQRNIGHWMWHCLCKAKYLIL